MTDSSTSVFHHRTRAMKLRTLFYSATDPNTARDIFRKIGARLKGLFGK